MKVGCVRRTVQLRELQEEGLLSIMLRGKRNLGDTNDYRQVVRVCVMELMALMVHVFV